MMTVNPDFAWRWTSA